MTPPANHPIGSSCQAIPFSASSLPTPCKCLQQPNETCLSAKRYQRARRHQPRTAFVHLGARIGLNSSWITRIQYGQACHFQNVIGPVGFLQNPSGAGGPRLVRPASRLPLARMGAGIGCKLSGDRQTREEGAATSTVAATRPCTKPVRKRKKAHIAVSLLFTGTLFLIELATFALHKNCAIPDGHTWQQRGFSAHYPSPQWHNGNRLTH